MRMRSLFVGLLTVAAILAVAASVYWFWWAGQLERGIAQWREQQRLGGYEVTYGGPAIDGFPFAHVARFDGPAVQAPEGAYWRGPTLTARAALWDPRSIEISFAGRHLVERLSAGRLDSASLDSREAEGLHQFFDILVPQQPNALAAFAQCDPVMRTVSHQRRVGKSLNGE